ncbi:MAG: signal peptidase II [Candidatus Peribacter sp.]|nr:signal peptidase II [Candidatus Peribacter sp.]
MGSIFSIAILSAGASVLAAVAADNFLSQRIGVMGSFAGLQYSLNPGVAFGISFAPLLQLSLIAIALLAVVWMAYRSVRSAGSQSYKLQAISYGLILGGGIANIIDRLPDGLVTDFFQVGTFPIFNVADSFITIGVVLLFWEVMRRKKPL